MDTRHQIISTLVFILVVILLLLLFYVFKIQLSEDPQTMNF